MILYMENRKDSTQKTTRTDKEIQQSSSIQDKHTEICAFLYTKNEIEKESQKKTKKNKKNFIKKLLKNTLNQVSERLIQ